MEEEIKEETKPKRHYKIEAGDKIKIKRSQYKDFVFYKTAILKKNQDGLIEYYDKILNFPKDTDLADGTTIIIKDFFEDCYIGKADKYNAIWTIRVLDYEIVEETSNEESIKQYLDEVAENGIEISDDMLPF